MELEDILLYAAIATTLALAAYAWRALRGMSAQRGWFLAALIGLTAYENLQLFLHPPILLSPAGVFAIWFRHVFFYAGQLCFFVFINRIIFQGFKDRTIPRRNERAAFLAFLLLSLLQLAMPHAAHAHHEVSLLTGELTPYHFLLYLTDQGLQHLIAIVFFLVSLAVLRSQNLYAQLQPGMPQRGRLIMPFLLGNVGFIAMHVWEFLVESRHLFASMQGGAGEMVEYAFFFFGLSLFLVGIRRLHENHL
jgi:hypothetical protein